MTIQPNIKLKTGKTYLYKDQVIRVGLAERSEAPNTMGGCYTETCAVGDEDFRPTGVFVHGAYMGALSDSPFQFRAYYSQEEVNEFKELTDLELFRSYWTDFISVEAFADYYGLTKDRALEAITLGREEHDAIAAMGGEE